METKSVIETLHRENLSAKGITLEMKPVIDTLNRIIEMELAGAILYTHYSFMVYGHDRMLIVKWLEGQAGEGLTHAKTAGELVTQLGAHPSLGVAPLTDTYDHDIESILRESLAHERSTLAHYTGLLELVAGKNVMLEEYARQHIYLEMQHIGEVDKMLRRPGDTKSHEAVSQTYS